MSQADPTSRLIARYRQRIEAARVYDVAVRSPLSDAPRLSARIGNQLLLKREDLQPVHSFKLRGAFNRIVHIPEAERARGVVCASAGNHAQGVALAARTLGCPSWIVMPRTTPQIKIDAVRGFGGRVVLHGDAYDDASAHAAKIVEERGATYIPPYDDPLVIAGQGTIAREIVEQLEAANEAPLDAVFVCVGGGGLLAGVAAYIKAVSPGTRVIGVEPEDSDCMGRALAAGRRVKLPQVGLFADGVAVRQAGRETFRVARATVDAMMTVSIDEICAAVRDVFYENRSVPEPAGALAVAGAKRWALEHGARDQRLCAIVSGANVNFDRLRHIAERAELGDHTEALLAVTIPERPGAFRAFCRDLGRHGITEFNYRYADSQSAHIFVGVRVTGGLEEAADLVEQLRGKDYAVVDLSGDEMAKVHIRYMVGGRAPGLSDERLFRVEFPERPGALLTFLNKLGTRWNVSLFHYRNHCSAHGRVLLGLQVPRGQVRAVRARLDATGYPWWEESGNAAYGLFLGTD
ncbi:threonine ammonia-lyase, biosynthetic [Algiphilus sp.]|uniref:threonine ammonia-lyase, biosynthetic n=1 Tax=Algiphilus sp. TaxID=1872431 RepID=UPI003C4AA207